MASLERTAYPRFKRLISERELREFFTPSAEEVAWARERTHDRPGRVLALLVMLKSAARLGRVPQARGDTRGKRHFTITVLNRCGADVVNAHIGLDLRAAWGDGSVAAVDGTMMDTVIDNLLAETSIRYGGYGGTAHHLVSDAYVALFSRFIPCGVWEAVYLIDSLLANESEVRPDTVHADTQGQSFPVFGLAHLLGIDLLPRIRNFQDLTFHRPDPRARYRHIDALFSADPRTGINWQLIENGWKDLI